MTQPDSDGAELRALQAQLVDKARALIQRERDVHMLLRTVEANNRWHDATAQVSSLISSFSSAGPAINALAKVLAEDFGIDQVVVAWGDARAERPRLQDPALREAFAHAVAVPCEGGFCQRTFETGAVRAMTRFTIPSALHPNDSVLVCLAVTERTAAFDTSQAGVTADQTKHLARLLRDAFDAVRLRQELVHERDSLQDTVRIATADLHAAVVSAETARAEAVRSARARTEFLANMSHEIRTPMTAILGFAELLVERDLDNDDRVRYAETIARSGRHLLQLLDDILNLARIESGHLRVEPTEVVLPNLLLDVHSLFAVRARERGVSLDVQYATPLPTRVRLDGDRLRQVLMNLVGNAIKFTDRGSIAIVASVDAGTTTLRVAVLDTGIGIPRHKLSAIFDSFEQVGHASRVAGGSGLGLAISRRLIALLGGQLTVTSELGHGSEFVVDVPYQPISPTDWVASPQVVTPDRLISRPRHLRGKVLVVDDTPVNRHMLQATLSRTGLEVETIGDGAEAVSTVRRADDNRRPFQLVFMDMQMPIVNGYEATAMLRAQYPTLPVVALTAHAMAGDRESCMRAGCTDYLSKPVRRDDLYDMVERWLPQDGTEATVERPAVVIGRLPTMRLEQVSNIDAMARQVTSQFAKDDVIRPMLPEFLVEMRTTTARLTNAVARGDRTETRALAHRLKGAAAGFGFPDLAGAAGDLERLAQHHEAAEEDLRSALAVVSMQASWVHVPDA